jgi:hemoglobin-like flavoprotein
LLSRAQIAARTPQLTEAFYRMLFDAAPELRPLFGRDATWQKVHLVAALSLVIEHADNPEASPESLIRLGARHVLYGVRPEHYELIRVTLLRAMAHVCASSWTSAIEAEWSRSLAAVGNLMREGAEHALAAAGGADARNPAPPRSTCPFASRAA